LNAEIEEIYWSGLIGDYNDAVPADDEDEY